ncbi:MAG: hypothetical protein AAGC68_13715, partial [Verrucomicrobiota bacterium]
MSPVPEVVKFRDTNGDGQADTREVIASGFGVHLAYAGHDMHGLFLGPDGRLYWSIGDKGLRVRTKDGLDYRFPNQGALMRCELDGSNFEVFAHGQRNIQEVSFDQYGNFFGVDNDADYSGERERLVYIEQYLDTGWRANWQYLRDDYNPWIDDLMHVPWHEDQPRWFTPPLSNYENGPAGFKFQPGTALNESYENYFFLTSAPRGEQWAFQVKPSGDSFEMINDHKIGEGVALVGLNFAPDGALYGVDWGGGYPLNQSGAVWRIDVPEKTQHPLRERTRELIRMDFRDLEPEEVIGFLRYPDQRVRLKAQFHLGDCCGWFDLENVALDHKEPLLARIHSIWGLGQAIRSGDAPEKVLLPLLEDSDAEVRAQAVKTLTDRFGRNLGLDRIPSPSGEKKSLTQSVIPLLEDPSVRVRQQALLGLGRLQDSSAADAILDAVARPDHVVSMSYNRHASIIAMAGAVPTRTLAALTEHESDFVRACAVIALRRRGAPEVSAFLSDPDPVTAADAARAIHDDWMIPEAIPGLAAHLELAQENEALVRRSINANVRIGDATAVDRVASFVADGKAPLILLEAGIEALENWTAPPSLDLVVGRYRPLEPRDPTIVAEAIRSHLDELLLSEHAIVRQSAMSLALTNDLTIENETLLAVFENHEASSALRAQALRSLAAQEFDSLELVLRTALGDKEPEVRIAAFAILTETDPDSARDRFVSILSGSHVAER